MYYIVSDPYFTQHQTGPWHPEQPARCLVIDETLNKQGYKTPGNTLKLRSATEQEILLCHSPSYLSLVQKEAQALGSQDLAYLSTGDATICKKSYEVALIAAGSVLNAIDQIMASTGFSAFCSVRPPGHHASASQGMGFCVFNNVAIGARYVQKKYGIKRVLIVDWDVHHGNGTQDIFYADPSVFYFSTHEEDLYPGTGKKDEIGAGEAVGTTLNCPIKQGMNSRLEVIHAFQNTLSQRMKDFQPEFVFISAGFDAHEQDPLGHFNLRDSDFALLTQIVKGIADQYAQGRLVSVLEGGYNLQALASSVIAHVSSL